MRFFENSEAIAQVKPIYKLKIPGIKSTANGISHVKLPTLEVKAIAIQYNEVKKWKKPKTTPLRNASFSGA